MCNESVNIGKKYGKTLLGNQDMKENNELFV
jgi:hypothetical protein